MAKREVKDMGRACSQGQCSGEDNPMAGTHRWPSKGSQTQVHSPCTEAGWGAGLGRGFLQGLAPLPLLPFNTMVQIQTPVPTTSP